MGAPVFVSQAATDKNISELPKTVWRTSLRKTARLGRGLFQFTEPLMHADTVYAGSATGGVFAIDKATGKRRWVFATQAPVYAPLALAKNILYAADAEGTVFAIDQATGHEVWRSGTDTLIMARPLPLGDRLFVITQRGELIAMAQDSGVVQWRTPERLVIARFMVMGASDPIEVNGNIVVGYADGYVRAHRPSDGTVAWEQRVAARRAVLHDVDMQPAPTNGLLLVGAAEEGLMAVQSGSGAVAWRLPLGSPNNLWIASDTAYAAGRGTVTAFAASTGSTRWTRDLPDSEVSAPVLVNGKVLTIGPKGMLYVLDASSGELLGTRHVGKGTYGRFAVDGDHVYVVTNGSHLVALHVP